VPTAPAVERKRAGAVMTPEEAFVALKDYIAYFGTYTVNEQAGTVTHHRADNLQPGESGDLVRRYEFVGDRLVLRPPNSTMEVTWERIK
jgi:Lipocalin-like domain